MNTIEFEILKSNDLKRIKLIAAWYLEAWNMPINVTIEKLTRITADDNQWHVIALENGKPVATGGIHKTVSLSVADSRFQAIPHWLALVYTIPTARQKGIASLLCQHLVKQAFEKSIDTLYLFTDTAEKMYAQLGWERVTWAKLGNRNVCVMRHCIPKN